MNFVKSKAINKRTGADSTVWLPGPTATAEPVGAEIMLGAENVRVDANVLSKLVLFNATRSERAGRGHDCAVFALACMLDKSFRGMTFNNIGGYAVKRTSIRNESTDFTPPVTKAGDIVLIAERAVENSIQRPHLLVHASIDEAETLYASKLGSEGPVVISTFGEAATFYGLGKFVAQVDGLELIDYPTAK